MESQNSSMMIRQALSILCKIDIYEESWKYIENISYIAKIISLLFSIYLILWITSSFSSRSRIRLSGRAFSFSLFSLHIRF